MPRPPPVVMFTTHDSRGEIIRGLMDGADGYLAKNFPPETLLKEIIAATAKTAAVAR